MKNNKATWNNGGEDRGMNVDRMEEQKRRWERLINLSVNCLWFIKPSDPNRLYTHTCAHMWHARDREFAKGEISLGSKSGISEINETTAHLEMKKKMQCMILAAGAYKTAMHYFVPSTQVLFIWMHIRRVSYRWLTQTDWFSCMISLLWMRHNHTDTHTFGKMAADMYLMFLKRS